MVLVILGLVLVLLIGNPCGQIIMLNSQITYPGCSIAPASRGFYIGVVSRILAQDPAGSL
jgi:hypothetical protein